MLTIPLTQKQAALIDDNDVNLTSSKWYAVRSRSGFYAARKWKTPEGKEGRQWLHHLILGISRLPKQIGFCADHLNGNTLDNRRCNLRIVPFRTNNQNTYKHRQGRMVGVRFYRAHRLSKPWIARIKTKGIEKHIGFFKTQEEASVAYQKACAELNG